MFFLIDLKETLPKINKKFPYINNGGCAKFANMLGEELTQLGFKVEYVVLKSNTTDIDFYRTKFKENSTKKLTDLNDYNIYCNHLLIRVNGLLIDSEGVYNHLSEMAMSRVELGTINKKTLDIWCKERVWNSTFANNHGKEIHLLKDMVKGLFN